MKLFKQILFIFPLLALFYGVFVSQYEINISNKEFVSTNSIPDSFTYNGVINVNTQAGSGTGSNNSIIEAAQKANLDFIIITDTSEKIPQTDSIEGYYDNLLVLVQSKYQYLDSKLILFNNKKHTEPVKHTHTYLTDLLTQQNTNAEEFLFLAHPYNPGNEWSGPLPTGLRGLEVVNLKSIWHNTWLESKGTLLWTPLLYPFNADLALLRLYGNFKNELLLWDQLNIKRKTIGLAGTDADSKFVLPNGKQLNIPSYYQLFKIMSNHVILNSELTGEFLKDKKKILNAIYNGQFYMALDILASSKGFSLSVRGNEKSYPIGAVINFKSDLLLEYTLPFAPEIPYEAKLFKNGEFIQSISAQQGSIALKEKGNYRLIVQVKPKFPLPQNISWIPWIITNNIYLK